jgi:hypothetical protein
LDGGVQDRGVLDQKQEPWDGPLDRSTDTISLTEIGLSLELFQEGVRAARAIAALAWRGIY